MANARRSESQIRSALPGVWVKRREGRFNGVVEIRAPAAIFGREATIMPAALVGNRNGVPPLQFSCSNIGTVRQGADAADQLF